MLEPCPTCDWVEIEFGLAHPRLYATNHLPPDGRRIVIGGHAQFNYEFFPKRNIKLKHGAFDSATPNHMSDSPILLILNSAIASQKM